MSTLAFIAADFKTDTGQLISSLPVMPKQFKTGSRGYYANQKVEIDGKRFQVQIQIIEIGSKKAAASDAESADS